MESLKQKYLAVRQWIVTKLLAISRHFATNFLAWLVALCIPPLILGALLFWQSRRVAEAAKHPLLPGRQVRKLEKEVAVSQAKVIYYQHASDSLGKKVVLLEQHTHSIQKQADSLHTIYVQTSSSWHSTAELQSYLLHYHPGPDPE